jgi:hypothetical protein
MSHAVTTITLSSISLSYQGGTVTGGVVDGLGAASRIPATQDPNSWYGVDDLEIGTTISIPSVQCVVSGTI